MEIKDTIESYSKYLGLDTEKIMDEYNDYLFENLALTLQMKLAAEAYYPDFTRRNYINAYEYNLGVCRQCMLIEIGAQTNTYQEAVNAAEPLAVLIDKVMRGE